MKWYPWVRGTIHPHRADIIMRGLAEAKLPDFKTVRALYINNQGNLWWSWHRQDFLELGEKLKIVLSSTARASKHFKIFDKYSAAAFKEVELIRSKDLTRLSNREIIKLYDQLFLAAYPVNIILAVDIDAFDTLLEDFLHEKIFGELARRCSLLEAEKIYRILAATTYRTYVNRQEVKTMELALRKDYSHRAVQRLWDEFWWTNLGWENMQPHSLNYFKNLIRQRSQEKGLAQKITFLKSLTRRNKQTRSVYFKKLNLSPRLKHWLDILDRYVYYHDLRKELQCRTLYAFHLLMSEVAKRLKARPEDLQWLWHHEIKALLNGQTIAYSEIKRRKNWVASISWSPRLTFYSGLAAKRIKDRELPVKKEFGQELKGLGVTAGLVRGRVKVCVGVIEALRKIKKGDILVTNMTTPDYVPIMKKVAAIITVQGGITCHAAIIARELRIPCIVGMKIATQILKDGDSVEVDVEKGIVKIIK